MKVLIIDLVHKILIGKLEEKGITVDYLPEISAEDTLKLLTDYQGLILRSKLKLTSEILEKNKHLRFIGRVGAGLENIDVETAKKLNIKVINSPEGNKTAVAEHTIGLILNLFHNICKSYNQIKNHIWQREANRGIELEGKTLGIIGYGNMGSAVAEKIKSLGVNVISYDKYKKNYSDNYTKEVDLHSIYEKADIVSFHVPLTDETKYYLNKNFIDKMHKPFFIINTSRGQVVKTEDLIYGLEKGKILGAGLDVLEYENFNFKLNIKNEQLFNRLIDFENVILTPHIAGLTKESFFKLSEIMAEKIIKFLFLG